jgi:hypothetical protein
VHTSMARAIQPFSTYDDGDTLFALSTEEIDAPPEGPSPIDLDTIAGETMWDAILASVPEEPVYTPPAVPASVPPATLALYAGRYRFGPNAVITVAAADGKLAATLSGMSYFDFLADREAALVPISDSDFYIAGRYGTRLSFRRGPAGTVDGAIVNPGRWQQAGVREP